MKKLCAFLLTVAMLLSLCIPVAFADGPAFSEGARVTVQANQNILLVTYPNTATLPDGENVPAYRIDITAKDADNTLIYSSVFATESHLLGNMEVNLPRCITLPALSGNYDVLVYPLNDTKADATAGSPVSASVTVTEGTPADGAVRYEFENYAPAAYPYLAESVVSASGGKLYTSHNGRSAWLKQTQYAPKNAELSTSFEIEIPADGFYTAEYMMGLNPNNNNLSILSLSVDGTFIGDNTQGHVQNFSMNTNYPWKYLPMYLFRKSGIELAKGTHTVDLTIAAPTHPDQNAQIFAADFLQFIPEFYTLTDSKETVIEFEKYAGKLMTDDGTGENTTASNVIYSASTSGAAALHTDSYAADDINKDAYLSIPITVAESGIYNIEYVASKASSHTNLYVDKTDLASLYENTAEPDVVFQCYTGKDMAALGLDGKEVYTAAGTSFWKYFWRAHHAAEKHTASLYLEAGDHTLILEMKTRGGSTPTVAICMDYMSFAPASLRAPISGTGKTVLEMEDYIESITTNGEPCADASITADEIARLYASGGKYLNMSERKTLENACITIPVSVDKTGEYLVNWYVTRAGNGGYLSRASLKVDGNAIIINDDASCTENLSHPDETGNHIYASQYYPMGRYEHRTTLTAGNHTITIDIDPITNFVNDAYGVKFNTDAITFEPYYEKKLEINGNTTIEFEDYKNNVTSQGNTYGGCSVKQDSRANGGAYMGVSYGQAEEAIVTIPVNVTQAGWYDVNLLMSKKVSTYLSTSSLYLDDQFILDNQLSYEAEDLSQGKTYIDANFPMHRYENAVYFTEGTHALTLQVAKTEGDQKVKFFADCIKLTPSYDSVAVAENLAISVSAYYDAPVQGTAIIASYKEGKLIKTASVRLDNEKQLSESVLIDETPDTVKIITLASLASAKPIYDVKVIKEFKAQIPRLFLMGDSVCAEYGSTSYAQQGWGHCIPDHFSDKISVVNNAVGGRSTKTYKTFGHWDAVYNTLRVGDFVMINFGLNDFYDISENGKGTTMEQYRANLTEYCTLIKEKGATPILISTIPECNTSHNSLVPRANAMKEVAQACGVVYLPLNETLNMEWIFDENGNYDAEKTLETFNYYHLSEPAFHRIEEEYKCTIPQDKWDYIANTPDRTHINIDGAKYVAKTIAELLAESDSALAKYLK